jgi:PH (Pleckstrin Homology) domain-containing protein
VNSPNVVQSNPLRSRLEAGEQILWEGRPVRLSYTFRGSPFVFVFTLVWLGFALFWEGSVLSFRNAPPFFVLWGAMFVLFGLYIAVGRFFVAAREADRTWYTVTDRRVIIRTGAFQERTVELSLGSLGNPQLEEGPRGVGTITFGPISPYLAHLGGGWPGARTNNAALIAIPDAARVFRLIDRARAAAP